MAIDARFYMHESDRTALDALKAIPGFTPLLKAFMKVFNEKQFHMQNMSTNLRLSERQLPEYYNMLPPICEKLGIEVPELYLELDGEPNAYTFGDTKPFIVITSGLLKKMPREVIPTVLAHECGHIACRHSLYTTMGQIIFNEATGLLGITDLAPFKDLITLPLQIAFSYWMRCSELSADRAAAIYDGNADKIVRMCMGFSGLEDGIHGQVDVEAFMEQAREYSTSVKENKVDKTIEFLTCYHLSHPLTAVRACECYDWMQTEQAARILEYVNRSAQQKDLPLSACLTELPMAEASRFYEGKETGEVVEQLRQLGFENVSTVRSTVRRGVVKPGQVNAVIVNNRIGFQKYEWLPIRAEVKVEYFEPETEEEIAAAHPGQKRVPNSARFYMGKLMNQAADEFLAAGFTSVAVENLQRGKRGLFDRDRAIVRITVNGQGNFERGEWFPADSPVRITYVTYTY